MALSASILWEVRPTNGTVNAGGGFNSTLGGSDFSQQNAVQVPFDGVAILAITGGASSTLTFTGYAPLGNDKGNLLAITGGTNFLPGIYEIRTSNAGAGSWTLDRNATSGIGAAMTGNMGGALSGFSPGATTLSSTLVAGQTVHVKNEAWNEPAQLSVAGTAAAPITIAGYNAARNDIQLGDGNANNPLNDRASAAGNAINVNATAYIFKNINTTRAGSSGFNVGGAFQMTGVNCRSFNHGADGFARGASNPIFTLIGCESDTNTSDGLDNTSGASPFSLSGSNFHNNGASGVSQGASGGSGPCAIVGNIFDQNASHNLSTGSASVAMLNNTIFGATGAAADGWTMTTPGMSAATNNIIAFNGRDGARATDADSVFADYNNFFGNIALARTNFPTGPHDLAVNPQFTLASTGDFSIAASLPGFPGIFPGGLSTGYLMMGAVQPQASGSGGSSTTVIVMQPVVIAPNNVVMM